MASFLFRITTLLLRGIAALGVVGATWLSLSCGGGGKLQLARISIVPQNVTVAGTPTIIYTAVGHYSQSTQTKDITSQVQWQTSAPSIVAFSDPTHPNYLLPTGTGCGSNLAILAIVYKDPSH